MSVRIPVLFALVLLLLLPRSTKGQGDARASACFFSSDFENGLPTDWDFGALVERQTENGDSLGEFVPAWTVGNAQQANANGYFPVQDLPAGNQFLMANDDAAPCNCTMDDVMATTPSLDFSARLEVAMECRVFHEMAPGAGDARIEVTTNGTNWDPVLTITPVQGGWQNIHLDLSTYDGAPSVRIRFRWSDGSVWSSGFALDDLCLRERFTHDLSVLQVFTHDPIQSPFVEGDQSLRYAQLPLEQVAPMVVAVEVINRGTSAEDAMATAEILLNGNVEYTSASQPIGILQPGERTLHRVATAWIPPGTGMLEVRFTVEMSPPDDDPSDNAGSTSMRITGPGWDNGYSGMAGDEGDPMGSVGGDHIFIAATRMEIANSGSTVRGISAFVAPSSTVGEEVRAILLDQNLAFVDTSTRHLLTQTDLDNATFGGFLYLPMASTQQIVSGDYFVGIQRLLGTGNVFIGTSGIRPSGSAVVMEGVSFNVTYVPAQPMVRLHFEDYGVGLTEESMTQAPVVQIHPVPMTGDGWWTIQLREPAHLQVRILDAMGRITQQHDLGRLPAGHHRSVLQGSNLAQGVYLLEVVIGDLRRAHRFVVER